MESLSIVVYTMKGCPFCTDFKEILTNEGIEFFDRDIEEYKDEYDIFVEVTENDMIPAMLIIEGDNKKHKPMFKAVCAVRKSLTTCFKQANNFMRIKKSLKV